MIPIYDAGGRLVGHVAEAKVLRPLPGGDIYRILDRRDRCIAVFFTGRRCTSPSCSCQAFQPHEVLSSCNQCRHHTEDHAWSASVITTSLITTKEA